MGIKGLGKFIKEYGNVNNLSFYKNKKIAIDTSIYLHKFMYLAKDQNTFLKRFVNQINQFRKHNIEPIYVFEGDSPIEKQETLNNRKKNKDKKILKLENSECEIEQKIIKKTIITITYEDIIELKKIFDNYSVLYIDSLTEGEKYAAFMNKTDKVDLVLSNDYDSLTFGCKYLLSQSNGVYTEYCLETILSNLDITYIQFIDLCIASGCDYTPGIRGFGPSKSLKMIKKHGLIENWPDIPEDFKLILDNIRNIFKNNPEEN